MSQSTTFRYAQHFLQCTAAQWSAAVALLPDVPLVPNTLYQVFDTSALPSGGVSSFGTAALCGVSLYQTDSSGQKYVVASLSQSQLVALIVATSPLAAVAWGGITGTLANQTDLQAVLDSIASSVSDETTRAESAEAGLASAISNEATARDSADAALASAIADETDRAQAAEALLASHGSYKAGLTPLVPATGTVDGSNLTFTYTTDLLPSQVMVFSDELKAFVGGEIATMTQLSGTLTIVFDTGCAPETGLEVVPVVTTI